MRRIASWVMPLAVLGLAPAAGLAVAADLIQTFAKPTVAFRDELGISLAALGNNVLVGARGDDTGADNAGSTYLFDGTTDNVLQSFLNPAPAPGDFFGQSVAAVGNHVAVGAPASKDGETGVGAVYLFDGFAGVLLRTLANPTPAARDGFGHSVVALGNNVIVGALFDDAGATGAGAAYLFDGTSGDLLQTFLNPTPADYDSFGTSVAAVGNDVLIGASGENTAGNDAGAVYLFNAASGNLLNTIVNPTPAPGDFFGRSVAGAGRQPSRRCAQ